MDTDCLKKELSRCLGCRAKPCEKACPLGVSPHDFIQAAKSGDYQRAAALIAARNPLPQTCGRVCPDKFCQRVCIRQKIDTAVEIPCLQAEMMRRGGYPPLELPPSRPRDNAAPAADTVAVIGSGAAGLGAVYELIKNGWHVDLYEKSNILGGAARLIPEYRLPKEVLDFEIDRLTQNDRVTIHLNTEIHDFSALKKQYGGVILALGETTPRTLGIRGEEYCTPYAEFLSPAYALSAVTPKTAANKNLTAAICGGGEVAFDCALTAARAGYQKVEMFVRRRKEDMRIQKRAGEELKKAGIIIHELTSVTEITCPDGTTRCLQTIKNKINESGKSEPCTGTQDRLNGYNIVIQALGAYFPPEKRPDGFILAGDMTGTSGTIVEALASGRAAAQRFLTNLNNPAAV